MVAKDQFGWNLAFLAGKSQTDPTIFVIFFHHSFQMNNNETHALAYFFDFSWVFDGCQKTGILCQKCEK